MKEFFTRKGIALAGLMGAVVYLTLLPILMILYGTLRDGPPGTAATFTLSHYVRAYSSPELISLVANTILFALGAAFVSFVLGSFLAWVTERTNTPFKGVIYALVLFPFVVPGILPTIGERAMSTA